MKKNRPPANPASDQRFSWTPSLPLQVSALLVLVFGAYWNSLDGGFQFDDQGIFLDPYIVNSEFGWGILRFMQTRPLTFLSFHWNYLAGGANPFGFHLVNVLFHAANCGLILLIARRELDGSTAWLAAALFAVHPLQTQAVNYIFERATLLAAFFGLLSLLFFLREKHGLSIAAFAFSLLAKEETIALPAFLLLYDVVRRRKVRRNYYAVLSGLAALATARLFFVLQTNPEAKLGFGRGTAALSYLLTQGRVIWVYLRLILIPWGLNLDHDIRPSQGLFSPPITFPAAVLLVILVGALAWLAWRGNQTALWALGFFVLLAPSSSVVPVVDVMFEHRTYFPLACLTIVASLLAVRWHSRWRAALLALLVAVLLSGTIWRNGIWHDDQSLWTDVVEKSPNKARGYFQLGQSYASQDPARARRLYEHGLQLEPANPVGHTNLGLVLLSQNEPEAALPHLRQALAAGNRPLVWNNIGAAQLRVGEIEDGIQSFRRALEINPCRFDARWNLVHTLSSIGRKEQALLSGQTPRDCHYLPDQSRKLEEEMSLLR